MSEDSIALVKFSPSLSFSLMHSSHQISFINVSYLFIDALSLVLCRVRQNTHHYCNSVLSLADRNQNQTFYAALSLLLFLSVIKNDSIDIEKVHEILAIKGIGYL